MVGRRALALVVVAVAVQAAVLAIALPRALASTTWTYTCTPGDVNYNLCTVDAERLDAMQSELDAQGTAIVDLRHAGLWLVGLAVFGIAAAPALARVFRSSAP